LTDAINRPPGFYWVKIGDHGQKVAEWREGTWRFFDPDRHRDHEPIVAVGERLKTPAGHTASSAQDAHRATASVSRTALEHIQNRWREPALTLLLITQCVTVFGLVPASAMHLSIPAGLVTALPLTLPAVAEVWRRGSVVSSYEFGGHVEKTADQ
jgi:hypothetical protein